MVTALLIASATMVPLTVTVNELALGTEFGSSVSENVTVSVAPLTWDAVTVGSVSSETIGLTISETEVVFVTAAVNAAAAFLAASWSGVASGPVGGV